MPRQENIERPMPQAYREPAGEATRSGGREAIDAAVLERSTLYSEELGIQLAKRQEREYFRWFLASLLFGARISETIARHTFDAFQRHDLLTPPRIVAAGWDYFVNPIMREGGYVRYDGRKSSQILRDCEQLMKQYGGELSQLHAEARTPQDLEERLLGFYGVGPVTANIFLRELRPFWPKANPEPLPTVRKLARHFGIDLVRYDRTTLRFARLEAGLLRLRRKGAGDRRAASRPD